MDELTGHEFLRSLRSQEFRVRALRRDIVRTESEMSSLRLSSLKERVTGAARMDLADIVARQERRAARLIEEWRDLEAGRERAVLLLEAVSDARLFAVLYHRYILAEPWERVAEAVHCVREYACARLHRDALAEFEKIYARYKTVNRI